MRRKRKIIVYVLSMVLMLTSFPIQLFAQVTNDLPVPMTALVDTQTTTPGAIQIGKGDYYSTDSKNDTVFEAISKKREQIEENSISDLYIEWSTKNMYLEELWFKKPTTGDVTQNVTIFNINYVKDGKYRHENFIIFGNGSWKKGNCLEDINGSINGGWAGGDYIARAKGYSDTNPNYFMAKPEDGFSIYSILPEIGNLSYGSEGKIVFGSEDIVKETIEAIDDFFTFDSTNTKDDIVYQSIKQKKDQLQKEGISDLYIEWSTKNMYLEELWFKKPTTGDVTQNVTIFNINYVKDGKDRHENFIIFGNGSWKKGNCLEDINGSINGGWAGGDYIARAKGYSDTNPNYFMAKPEDGFSIYGILPEISNISFGSQGLIKYNENGFNNIDGKPEVKVEFNPYNILNDGMMNLQIKVTNIGNIPINLDDIEIKYYYTNDNGLEQKIYYQYASKSNRDSIISLKDYLQVDAIEMDVPKQLADTYIKTTFKPETGKLNVNENVFVNIVIYNDDYLNDKYILENDHSYQINEISTFSVGTRVNSTSNMVNANNIVVAASWLPWNWGNEPKNYEPTFTAFKIGQGGSDKNKIDDYRTFTRLFVPNFTGRIKSNFSLGNNIEHEFNFTEDNLKEIIESDITYISGHGFKGGTIPIYSSVKDDLHEYSKVLVTDKNINNFQYSPNNIISNSNKFSINMKDNRDKGWDEQLNWIILGACSQLNDTDEVSGYTSVEKWIDVLKNNKKLKGILGYYGTGPSASNIWKKDYEIIDDFLTLAQPMAWNELNPISIYNAWESANFAGFTTEEPYLKILDWGILVKGNCADSTLYNSLADNRDVKYNKIYLYRAKMMTESYANSRSIDTINTSTYDDIIHQVEDYIVDNNLMISINDNFFVSEVTRTTYDTDGNNEGCEVVEYLVLANSTTNENAAYSIQPKSAINSKNNDLVFLFKVDINGVMIVK